jgi:DNA-binding XRE family transcriptional regulator
MVEDQQREIAHRIRELRERSAYTQQDLADKLGLTVWAYQRLERRGTSRWRQVVELADAHEIDPEWIWGGEVTDGHARDSRDVLKEIFERLDRIEERLGLHR